MYAAPDRTKPVAIVVPAEPALLEIASENGIDDKDLEGLVQDEKIQAIALQSMQALGRKNGLAGIEIIDGVVLVETPWTPQNVSFLFFIPSSWPPPLPLPASSNFFFFFFILALHLF